MNLTKTVLAAAAAMCLCGAANASVIQLVHFDELQGNPVLDKYYDPDNNFKLEAEPDGVNFNSSTLCADSTTTGNGHCILEQDQDQTWIWTHDVDADPTLEPLAKKDPDIIPDENYGDDTFNPLSFFFQLTGNGGSCIDDAGVVDENCDNFMRVALYADEGDYLSDDPIYELIFKAGLTLNTSYLTYEDGTSAEGDLLNFSGGQGNGYFVDLSSFGEWGSYFIVESGADAQIRLDCFVFEHNGSTSQPYDASTQCGLGVIPLPGGLPLMASALGIIGILTTRRKLTRAA